VGMRVVKRGGVRSEGAFPEACKLKMPDQLWREDVYRLKIGERGKKK